MNENELRALANEMLAAARDEGASPVEVTAACGVIISFLIRKGVDPADRPKALASFCETLRANCECYAS